MQTSTPTASDSLQPIIATQQDRPDGAGASATPPPHRSRWLLLVFLLAAIALAYALFNWNLFKGTIERRVSSATGRDFHIDGDLHVAVSMHPLITADGLRLGNAPGAKDPTMLAIQQLQVRIELWPWFKGQRILSEMHLVKPVLLLEKDPNEIGNWVFNKPPSAWTIRQFTVDQGTVFYREPSARTDLTIKVYSGPSASNASGRGAQLAPLLLHGSGLYKNNPFALQGRVDSPLELRDAAEPYQIDIGASAGRTKAHVAGTLRHPLQMTGFDLDFALAGPDLALLYPLIGVATPETAPYSLRGRLGHLGHIWKFSKFSGRVGGSDLGGDVTIDASHTKSILTADLVSKRLDFGDLAGFVGAPPKAVAGETASPEQRTQAAQAQASARVLPDKPYQLDRLRGMDADVRLRAQRLIAPKWPLDSMLVHLYLKDGVLRLDPLNFGAADGRIESQIQLDASRPLIVTTAKIKARKLDLGKLLPTVKLTQTGIGRIGADIDLKGSGNSVASMLGTADGRVVVGMGQGQISNLLLEYAALDLGAILKAKIVGDHNIQIRCLVGDFTARKGMMNAQRLVFDTSDMLLRASGTIDLRNEQLALRITAKPKDHSFLSLRAPLDVSGTFKHPSVRPDIKALGIRGIAAIVLGAIAPPAAELALIEYGGGKDSDCVKSANVTR